MPDTIQKQTRFLRSVLTNQLDQDLFTHSKDLQPRLDVYRRNYMQSLRDLLESKFPVTAEYLGGLFQKMAMEYVVANPPRVSGQFALYGASFSDFLVDSVAQELARLEWLFQKIAMATEDAFKLKGMPTDDAYWQLRSDIIVTRFKCNILSLYDAIKAGRRLSPVDVVETFYVFLRNDEEVEVKVISSESYKVLSALSAPHTIAQLSHQLTFSQTVWNRIFLEVFHPQFVKVTHGAVNSTDCKTV